MPSSRFFPIAATALVLGIILSAFVLPIGYTYGETCPTCQGRGTVTCETCHGSGKCPVCGGTGEIWYMPEYDNWCAFCQGTGTCYTCWGTGSYACVECGGTGTLTHWMYTLAGSIIVLSIVNVLLFLGLFAASYAISDFYLGFNDWVYNVEDMGYWFNPSFMTWLFARHPERWAKWQTVLNLPFAVYFGSLFFWYVSLRSITQDALVAGIVFGFGIAVLFSLVFYKTYVSRIEPSE